MNDKKFVDVVKVFVEKNADDLPVDGSRLCRGAPYVGDGEVEAVDFDDGRRFIVSVVSINAPATMIYRVR